MGRRSDSRGRTEQGRRIAAALEGAWRACPPPLGVNADELATVAPVLIGTGAGALAWWRLRAGVPPPGPRLSAFKDAYRLNTLTNAIQEERIARAVQCLRSAGIEPFLAKGWAAARLYPEPGLRPSGDIDLYVPRDRHPEARQALEAGGAAGGIDLHRGFDELDDRDPGQLRARSRTMAAAGVEVRLFGAEDHLRLLGLHLLRHGVSRPLWLCDVGAAVESSPDGFDWEYFRSGSRWRAQAAAITLALAHRLLGARLEAVPLGERAGDLPSWLVPAVLRQWGGGPAWRDAMAGHLRSPAAALRELPRHWPNPVEATAGVKAPFNELPRLPFQLAFAVLRAARFAGRHVARRPLGRP